MTREEIKKAMRDTKREIVIKNLHKLLSLVEGYPEYEDCISYAIELLEQEPILDNIRAEIERQERWLMDTGYNAFSVGMAFDAIKAVITESEE